MATFQTLPGFREFYPDALARRSHIFRLWRQAAHTFGFQEYDAPVLGPLELYKAKTGDDSALPAEMADDMRRLRFSPAVYRHVQPRRIALQLYPSTYKLIQRLARVFRY